MGDEDKKEEELDLDQQLDMLDLDTDFLADSTSFDEGGQEDAPPPEPAPASPKREQQQQQPSDNKPDWADRMELYSKHFKPDPKERQALEAIAHKLGVKSGLPKTGGGIKNPLDNLTNPLDNLLGGGHHDDESDPHDPQSQWNRLVNGKGTKQTQNLPVSIVLQQGTVMYKDLVDSKTGETITHHGCELILLTRGFLLAQKEESSGGFFGKKQETLVPLGSALWTDVRQIQTTAYRSLVLTCGKDVRFDFLPPGSGFEGWKTAMETAATQAHLKFDTCSDAHSERGWQYRLCPTPWFTEAVTGEWQDDVGLEMPTGDSSAQLDELDDYNGYAPLHYATRANHADVVQRLLEAGADPNLEDGEGKTPMYFAERDQLPASTVAVLTRFGAVPSQKAQDEMRGELFGKVNDTNQAREEKRLEAEAAAARAAEEKAQTAQNQMAQNMAMMHKRGEMIEELGDKATDLQDGAQDYADMAKQLKEKMKKKSIWGF